MRSASAFLLRPKVEKVSWVLIAECLTFAAKRIPAANFGAQHDHVFSGGRHDRAIVGDIDMIIVRGAIITS
jgi:hypothetical protein